MDVGLRRVCELEFTNTSLRNWGKMEWPGASQNLKESNIYSRKNGSYSLLHNRKVALSCKNFHLARSDRGVLTRMHHEYHTICGSTTILVSAPSQKLL